MHSLQQSTGAGAQDVDYCIMVDGLVIFKDKIYTLDRSDDNKVILREFHAKPYSGHPSYQKTLAEMNNFYYWLNLKRGVAEFVVSCLYC